MITDSDSDSDDSGGGGGSQFKALKVLRKRLRCLGPSLLL
jgi:hypothetical protein